MDSFIGAIFSTGFNFAPVNYLPCDGRSLQISQYDALYALIGTTYGGNGVTTFNLPNMLSRVPIGTGQGAGLSNYVLAQTGGAETFTITTNNMPSHTHQQGAAIQIPVNNTGASTDNPVGAYYGISAGTNFYSNVHAGTSASTTKPSSVVGNPQLPVDMLSPALVVNYFICVNGLYPVHP